MSLKLQDFSKEEREFLLRAAQTNSPIAKSAIELICNSILQSHLPVGMPIAATPSVPAKAIKELNPLGPKRDGRMNNRRPVGTTNYGDPVWKTAKNVVCDEHPDKSPMTVEEAANLAGIGIGRIQQILCPSGQRKGGYAGCLHFHRLVEPPT